MIIGISGGTAQANDCRAEDHHVGRSGECCLPQQDAYYRNLGDMPIDLRHKVNYDHPDAFDTELLINHLEALRAGENIEQPIYDYATHSRKAQTICVEPRPVNIIEGILVFVHPQLRGLMDLKIFVDADADIRFIRRLNRDVHERGRPVESIIAQYTTTVRPMHLQFVEPSKRYADIIIPKAAITSRHRSNHDEIKSILAGSTQRARRGGASYKWQAGWRIGCDGEAQRQL